MVKNIFTTLIQSLRMAVDRFNLRFIGFFDAEKIMYDWQFEDARNP